MVCSIQSRSPNRTSQVRFSPSKPDLICPKNTYLIVIGFLQAFIEPWEPNDRLHGIPGDDLTRASRKTPPEGGRKSMQRERHKKTNSISERMVCLWQNWASLNRPGVSGTDQSPIFWWGAAVGTKHSRRTAFAEPHHHMEWLYCGWTYTPSNSSEISIYSIWSHRKRIFQPLWSTRMDL